MKNNVILTDCVESEIKSFAEGISKSLGEEIKINSSISNWTQKNKLMDLYRYVKYFTFPFVFFLFHRKEYKLVIGWQQFYAILFAFYCKLFRIRKTSVIVACNFTYKRKNGIIGKIYHAFMKYAVNNSYLDYCHVPSHEYVQLCCDELGVSKEQFIVTNFGVPDIYDIWKKSVVNCSNYVLSIGRSNRDFDFLIEVWSDIKLKDYKLIIISDTYHVTTELSPNVEIINNIFGDAQFPWLFNADLIIIPIADGRICSGDTVLLNGMVFEKTIIVTKPSTLYEMYIQDGKNGYALEKEKEKFASFVSNLLACPDKLKYIGKQARQSYINNFSRYSMGEKIGNTLYTIIYNK